MTAIPIRIARANASGMANYRGSAGELVYNYSTNNLHFFTNTANVYYTSSVPVIYYYQGTVAAYSGLGYTATSPSLRSNVNRMPFATDTNFADTGYDWQYGGPQGSDGGSMVTHSSDTDAYVSGGSSSSYRDHVQKFSFANNADATDHGELSVVAGGVYMGGSSGAQPHASQTHAYYSGGLNWLQNPTTLYAPGGTNQPNNYKTTIIRKWPFAAGVTGNSVKTGDLTAGQNHSDPAKGSLQSLEHGYVVGGQGNPPTTPYYSYDQDRYPFASDENATDVGEYSGNALSEHAAFSSETHGYCAGGVSGHPGRDTILKFAFSSSLSFTDTGELTGPVGRTGGTGSTTAGYVIAGKIGSSDNTNRVDKIPFANDTSAVDVADYVMPGYNMVSGMQD